MQENKNIYSVKQVNFYIKRMFEDDFILHNIYVKGEVSNCKYHYSGHIYFSLKDESGVISAVMFASNAAGLKFRLTDGMQVVVYGSVTVYERDGKYQLYARRIENDGQGNLYRQFEELKQRLADSGMFEAIYKKPVPRFSMKIGVVTAETGAVIRDIYNVASRRNPYAQIYLYPAKVQGTDAAATICAGIKTLDKMGLDTIIIGRGGGSIEDLWAFNEESVARAIFEAQTPIISAVGHETDFTIADFAADLRAPTPSAAAELAVFDYARFLEDLQNFRFRLIQNMNHKLRQYQSLLQGYSLNMERLSPQNQVEQKIRHLMDQENKLDTLMKNRIAASRERLIFLSERLSGLSPLKRLSEGYAFVSDENGKTIKSVEQVSAKDPILVQLADGEIKAEAISVSKITRESSYGK